MIFLTLGTQHPFDRLVRVVDRWAAANPHEEVFGQIPNPEHAGYLPANFEWAEALEPSAYQARFESASLVIAHAGMGSIITAQSLCKPIVIFPRRAALGEHRNDHQLATAKRFRDRPGILAPVSEAELFDVLTQLSQSEWAVSASPLGPYAEEPLTSALRTSILDEARRVKWWSWLTPARTRSRLAAGD